MTCQVEANRVSKFAGRLSSGLSQMSSKQAFFTGLAVGASGTGLGALLVANRQRITNLFQRPKSPRQALVLWATLNEQEMAGINGTGGLKKEARAGLFR